MFPINLKSDSSHSSEEDWLKNTQKTGGKGKVRRAASESMFAERFNFLDQENRSQDFISRPRILSFRERTKTMRSTWLYSNAENPNTISTIPESPKLSKVKRKKEHIFNETLQKDMRKHFENHLEKIDTKYIKNYVRNYYKNFLFESYKNTQEIILEATHKDQLTSWNTIYHKLVEEKKLLDPIINHLIEQKKYLEQRCEELDNFSQWTKDTIILLNLLISYGKDNQVTLSGFFEAFDLSSSEEIIQNIQYLLSGGKRKKKSHAFNAVKSHIQSAFFYNNHLNEFRDFYDRLINVKCISNQIYHWKGAIHRIQDITLKEAVRSLVTENIILRDIIYINGEEHHFSNLQEDDFTSNLQENFLNSFLEILYNTFNCFEGTPEECTKVILSLAGYTQETYETSFDYSSIFSLLKMCSQSSWNFIEELTDTLHHPPYHLKRTSVGKLKIRKNSETVFVTRDALYSIYLKEDPEGYYVDINTPLANFTFKWTLYWSHKRQQWRGRLSLPDGIKFTEHATLQNRSDIFESILQL